MTRPNPRRAWRRWAWAGLGAGLAAVAALFAMRPPPPVAPAVAPPPEAPDPGYVIEDGLVVWRPLRLGERIVVSVLSLGLAANEEWVVGQKLPDADAASFHALGRDHGRDKARVWYRTQELAGADPDSFAVLAHEFSRDRAHLWRRAEMVMPLDPGAGEVRVHSARMFGVGDRVWLTGARLTPLPEAPQEAPIHACRDWFMMNGALWRGAERVLPLDGPAVVLDCDNHAVTHFIDGQPREDVSENRGLLLGDGSKIWRIMLAGPPALIAELPGPVVKTRLLYRWIGEPWVLLALMATGEVFALIAEPGAALQPLGRAESLPGDGDLMNAEGFWLAGRYYTLRAAHGGPPVEDHGPAMRYGDYAFVGGALFDGARVMARPGGLPLRRITDAIILVGPSCLDYGHFVTDLPDPAPEPAAIAALCDSGRPPPVVLYDGLRIGFTPALSDLGPDAARPDLNRFALGEIFIENAAAAPRALDAAFLAGFALEIDGTPIALDPTPPTTLQPGQRHVWRPEALSEGGVGWNWVLRMRHDAARAAVFGDGSIIIGAGGFGGVEQ